ncbi:MAG TPA: SDR family NAD(P)-dependent oxidoreductase [Steroidobacteraceae bacterium]|nr:SDR family NAD(P)-dependent oxidoreductase [Steroidobacteraceae bacterium]
MARVFITGSTDGLGLLAARRLIQTGHRVVLHARSAARAAQALTAAPGAEAALIGDLASIAETRHLAEQANQSGRFDAVIHNAAVGYQERRRVATVDGLAHVFAINTLAPYLLTALIARPRRLVYLSSALHRGADASLEDLNWERRAWQGTRAYSDTKLHDAMLAFGIARRWSGVLSNALEPGWVATKMGGPNAPDDLTAGAETQAWLASSDEPAALVNGQYFYHQRPRPADPATHDAALQDRLIAECARLSGVALPP